MEKRCFTIALIFLCILSEPLFWNSNAIAQMAAEPSFVVDVQPLLKAPEHKAEQSFQSPNFVSLEYLQDREAKRTPLQIAALFPPQDRAPAPSTPTTEPSGGSSSTSKKKSNKLIWILVAAGGGTAAALLVMKKSSGGSSSSDSGGNRTTVTVGSPIVVSPQ